MRATKQVYKQQGNIGLFDKEETTNRLNKVCTECSVVRLELSEILQLLV